ncbi:tRNA (guanosine(46)-N7)-methyltransferase TrmB [Lacrimispora sp. NSJ-141]|uniref:tRNA (guanine-N(7)-)-methyltransferase n=1 Tax=Lientehia hominis TaxID=2897778 RepID=A0AAP2RJC2_9FIRM|nr:tRNA (guanosine(46)-N7)-methyltransferase TrmB [Lientehia hominis]MCD2493304.1 tRNA (guanosine(46)-N7)-methyltransferase TrmB [Lientehia hominis]
MRLRNVKGARDVLAENPYVVNDPERYKGSWGAVFGNQNPIYIEIGMGKGRFLLKQAELNPEINFIGIEMYASVLVRAVQKAEGSSLEDGVSAVTRRSLPEKAQNAGIGPGGRIANLRFLNVQAEYLENLFSPGEVSRIYLNFSDPWPKARHAKRRLTSSAFLSRYEKILKENGCVEFKTDNRKLFEFSLESVEESGWRLLSSTFDLHKDAKMSSGNVMTEYEQKFSEKGHPICKLVAQRKCS